jgi:hypothetical protein
VDTFDYYVAYRLSLLDHGLAGILVRENNTGYNRTTHTLATLTKRRNTK